MASPYGIEITESCAACDRRSPSFFCTLDTSSLHHFDSIRFPALYPKGALLFVEGQTPRGVFLLCCGRVKLLTSSGAARVLITDIAEAGEVLGLSAALAGHPYEVTAVTLEACQVNFIKREEFLRFLEEHGGAGLRVARQLSDTYRRAFEQVRLLGLSTSAAEKLARLLMEWCERQGRETERGMSLKLTLTHEEMGQLISASRETVTRLLGEFKEGGMIEIRGATLVVRDRPALEALTSP